MEPAYAGDRQARGVLAVRALETGGSVLAFTQPEVVTYDIDLPSGAVFASRSSSWARSSSGMIASPV